jgi:hypothetical protein
VAELISDSTINLVPVEDGRALWMPRFAIQAAGSDDAIAVQFPEGVIDGDDFVERVLEILEAAEVDQGVDVKVDD